jgi:hypothetical protein
MYGEHISLSGWRWLSRVSHDDYGDDSYDTDCDDSR